jgi:hypothetical protein
MACNLGRSAAKCSNADGIVISAQNTVVVTNASSTPRRPYKRPNIQAKGSEIKTTATTSRNAIHINIEAAGFENGKSRHVGKASAAATPAKYVDAMR